MTKSFFLIALLISLCILGANAQTINRLPVLEEMFRLADENNRRIKAQTSAVYEAEMGVKTAKNALLPSIEASLSLAYNADGLIINRDFSNSFTAHIPHFGNNFALEVSQIIYAGGAIKNGIEIAKMHSQITSLNAENSRQEVRFLITGNYLELCKLKNQLQVFESHVEQTKNMLDKMHRRYNEGVALQNDITRYELQLQNLYYSKIQLSNMVHILNDRLVAALGMPPSTVIAADTFYIHPF
jgi:outer membrane protein TolC